MRFSLLIFRGWRSVIHWMSSVLSFLMLNWVSCLKIFFLRKNRFKRMIFLLLSNLRTFTIVVFTLLWCFRFWRFLRVIKDTDFRSVLSRLTFSTIMWLRSFSFTWRRSWFSVRTFFFRSWDRRSSSVLMCLLRFWFLSWFLFIKDKRCVSYCFDSLFIVKLIVWYHSRNVIPHILNKSQSFQNWNVFDKLLIFHIIIPINNWHSTFRLKQVWNGGVV